MKRVVAMCLLAACGGSSDPPITPDSPAPVQPGGPVTIAIERGGQPQPSVEVVFQNADSAVVAQVVTDATGQASGNVEADGYVTVIEPRPQSMARDRLSTFAGVQPGDALHLDLEPPAEPVVQETFQLKISPDTEPGQVGHVVRTSCGEAAVPATDTLEEATLLGCGGIADMLVVSIDDTGSIFRSHFHRDQPLTSVDLSGFAYVAFVPATVTFDAVPEGTSFIGVYRAIKTDNGLVFDVTGGAASPSLATSINLPTGFEQRDVLMTSTTPLPPPDAFGQHTLIEWTPLTALDYTLRVADKQVLPFSALPTYDLASRTASWTEGATGQLPNYVQVSLNVYRDDIPEGRGWDWRMVAPRNATSYAYPALPLDRVAFDFNVLADNGAGIADLVSVHDLITAKLQAGYDVKATREHAFADLKAQIAGEMGELSIQTLVIPQPPGEPEL